METRLGLGLGPVGRSLCGWNTYFRPAYPHDCSASLHPCFTYVLAYLTVTPPMVVLLSFISFLLWANDLSGAATFVNALRDQPTSWGAHGPPAVLRVPLRTNSHLGSPYSQPVYMHAKSLHSTTLVMPNLARFSRSTMCRLKVKIITDSPNSNRSMCRPIRHLFLYPLMITYLNGQQTSSLRSIASSRTRVGARNHVSSLLCSVVGFPSSFSTMPPLLLSLPIIMALAL